MTLFGVHSDLCYFDAPTREREIALLAPLGARVSRSTLVWRDVERSPGVYDWSVPDAVVNALRARNAIPLLWVGTWPSWLGGYRGQWTPPTDYLPAVNAYARFCALAAKRYKGKVARFEVWNEQNEHYFWGTIAGHDAWPSLHEYAVLYLAARQAIHSANPNAHVAVGGLAGLQAGDEAFGSGLGWLSAFLTVVPPRTVQRVALHPYTSDAQAPDVTREFRDNFSAIGAVRAYLDSIGRSDVKLWVTEWGWRRDVVGDVLQAEYVTKSLAMMRALYPYLEVATYFSDRDKGGVSSGLYAADYTARPASVAYRVGVS